MALKGSRENLIILNFVVVTCLCLFLICPQSVHSQCNKKPVIFNFGDSNSDTGEYMARTGPGFRPPNGRKFFHRPSGRLCDGRLMIDFLCESLKTSYLAPYMESSSQNFSNGVNFAKSGSSTLPRFGPLSLDSQMGKFFAFRTRSPKLISSQGYINTLTEEEFGNALYIIDIGQNDLAGSLPYFPYQQVISKIPSFITVIKYAILSIYQRGGRNFWVHNTGPLGCLPQKLATSAKSSSDFDENGCIRYLNDAARTFNKQLHSLCEELRSNLKDVIIVYIDIFAIKYDLISNAAAYGFENPLTACCGYGGPPYNYNPNTLCGKDGYDICKEGSRFISWDGVHYTEDANSIFASKILTTNYSNPQINFNFFCT